jgi:site-specific DNA recombinase
MIQRAKRARPAPSRPDHVRVAIYTRKSVTEGLGQQFNTLHAQREAVEGHVRSMQRERWQAIEERYDDGGFSGATTDRPAFQRLMADVAAGKVDVVAVYRLDRLSRSLLDFAGLMREFELRGVAFVSVTERFDSSTPIGRMTLNLLATFAQFERETIALRTKDKVSASRRRGMFTGGRPILGFDIVKKKLVVNEQEADVVRRVFDMYLEIGGLVATVEELRLRGVSNKRWTTKSGEVQGGSLFEKNSLGTTLRNVLYIGQVRAGDEVVDGEHEAIVERDVWDAVQARLAAQAPNTGARASRRSTALLSGIARCKCGAAMTPTTAKGRGRTYAYYACAKLVKQGSAACPGSRVAAHVLEPFVIDQVRQIGRKPEVLEAAIAAERDERDVERAKLAAEMGELRAGRGRHIGDRARLIAAIGGGTAPASLVARVEELDGLVSEADARIAGLERDLVALDGASDIEGFRAALREFDELWGVMDQAERANVLGLVLDEVIVNGAGGDAELRFRGSAR